MQFKTVLQSITEKWLRETYLHTMLLFMFVYSYFSDKFMLMQNGSGESGLSLDTSME